MSTALIQHETYFAVPVTQGSHQRRRYSTYRGARLYAEMFNISYDDIEEVVPNDPPAGMVESVMAELV